MPQREIQRVYAERYRILGLRIAYYRKLSDYTQETFAEKIGRSASFVAQVESPGTLKGVSLETLFRMSDALGVPTCKLLEGES